MAPLLKTVAASAGDRVDVLDSVRINGTVVPYTAWQSSDFEGRSLPRPESRRLVSGELFLLSDNAENGFDSRYFGPVPERWVIGRISPVWTVGRDE